MQVVNIHQAKTNLSKLLEQVNNGDDVIIAKAGKPIAKLIAFKKRLQPRKPGLLIGKIVIPDDFDEEDPAINKFFYS